MVAVTLNHARDACAVGRQPSGIIRKTVHRHHAVGFDVCLINHIQAIAVTKLIPERGIRIMRAADGIKVILLHQQNVLHHIGLGHDLAAKMMVFMAINAANQQRLAIHPQQPVFDLDLAETHVARFGLNQLITLPHRHNGAITVRRFRAPQQWALNRQPEIGTLGVIAPVVDHRRAKGLANGGNLLVSLPESRFHFQFG
ncbi:hypothetical protein D3C75_732880 [compost metagenome]